MDIASLKSLVHKDLYQAGTEFEWNTSVRVVQKQLCILAHVSYVNELSAN